MSKRRFDKSEKVWYTMKAVFHPHFSDLGVVTMKKKILSIVSVMLMLAMLAVPFTASADEEGVVVSIGSASAAQGAEIDVPITVDKNPGIWGINWKVYYDSQVLRFDGIEFNEAFADLGLLDTNEVKYPVMINGMGSSVTENVNVTGEIAVIHFKVFVGVELGDTVITMKVDDGNNINVDSEDIPLTVNEGKITVTKGLTKSDNPDDYPPKEPLQEVVPHNTPIDHGSTANGGKTWLWIVIGAAVLLVVVVLIWLFSGSGDEEKGKETSAEPAEVTPPTVPLDVPVVEETPAVEEAPAVEDKPEE